MRSEHWGCDAIELRDHRAGSSISLTFLLDMLYPRSPARSIQIGGRTHLSCTAYSRKSTLLPCGIFGVGQRPTALTLSLTYTMSVKMVYLSYCSATKVEGVMDKMTAENARALIRCRPRNQTRPQRPRTRRSTYRGPLPSVERTSLPLHRVRKRIPQRGHGHSLSVVGGPVR